MNMHCQSVFLRKKQRFLMCVKKKFNILNSAGKLWVHMYTSYVCMYIILLLPHCRLVWHRQDDQIWANWHPLADCFCFFHRCTEWSTVRVSTKPLITEGNWPGQGLNQGLPNDTPALYPLRHELMLLIGRLFALLFLNCRGSKIFVLTL
jgi:hypothetical protein